MGGVHARNLLKIPEAQLTAVADLDDKRGEPFRESGARVYRDWRTMLDAEKELDAVILATPALIRREPIEAFSRRGIALFCEKPPALSSTEAAEISGIIEQAGVLSSVGFMYRWSPLADRIRELIAKRPLLFARIVVAWPVFRWVKDGGAPKLLYSKAKCGGPLIEQAIHFQDVLRYLTGDEPVGAQAFADLGKLAPTDAGRDCEETTAYILRHTSGMVSSHIHNWSHQGTTLQLQIVAEHLDLTWQLEGQRRLFGTVDGTLIDETSDADLMLNEMTGFVRAVQQADPSLIRSSYADAARSLRVVEAAAQAVESGQPTSI